MYPLDDFFIHILRTIKETSVQLVSCGKFDVEWWNCTGTVLHMHLNSIDKMMMPFKGNYSSIKQYIKGNSNSWDLKIWTRTGPLDCYATLTCIRDKVTTRSQQGHEDDHRQVDNKLATRLT